MKSFATTIFPMDVKLKLSTRKVWESFSFGSCLFVCFPESSFLVQRWFKTSLRLVAPLLSQESYRINLPE